MPSTTVSDPSNGRNLFQQVADDIRAIRDLLDTHTPPPPPRPDGAVEVTGD